MASRSKYVRRKHTIRFEEKLESDFQFWWKDHRKYKRESEAFNAYVLELIQLSNEQRSLSEWLDEKGFSLHKPLENSEEKIVHKPFNRDYPECDDMYPIEGKPTKRECVLKASERPIHLPKTNGTYVVDNPNKCRRCKAKGLLKPKRRVRKSITKTLRRPALNEVMDYKICPIDGEKKYLANCEMCRTRTRKTWVACQKQELKIHS